MTVTFDVGEAAKFLVAAAFVLAIVGAVALIRAKIKSFIASRAFDRQDLDSFRRAWTEVEAILNGQGEVSRKLAVLEADKLLDRALKSMTMPGATLGERLKFAAYKYPEIRSVWWAHRLRNQLAHEPNSHLDRGLAVKAVREFKRALTRIGAL
jgi:hypothetical protein